MVWTRVLGTHMRGGFNKFKGSTEFWPVLSHGVCRPIAKSGFDSSKQKASQNASDLSQFLFFFNSGSEWSGQGSWAHTCQSASTNSKDQLSSGLSCHTGCVDLLRKAVLTARNKRLHKMHQISVDPWNLGVRGDMCVPKTLLQTFLSRCWKKSRIN